jgi:hypothetical protein
MVPPVVMFTLLAFTEIKPPLAEDAEPDVVADSVPLFWSVTVLAETSILPPAPVPSVFVKTPLPAPSIRTD